MSAPLDTHSAPEVRSTGLRAVFHDSAVKVFPKNALIFTEGNRSDSVYLIESGRVKLFLANAEGKEIDIGDLGPGEIFGDTELDFSPRSVSAMTLEPSKLLIARQSEFRRLIEHDPQVAMELVLKLTSRNREMLKKVKSLALMDVSDRVAQLLLEMATEENGKLVINEKVSKRNIANRVGATREMASRVFGDLVARGYIQLENNKITVSRKMVGLLASAAFIGLSFALALSGNFTAGDPDPVAASINSLPATAAGMPATTSAAAGPPLQGEAHAIGTIATGRVARLYVKSAEGVLIELGRAPKPLKEGAQRWAEIQFPELDGGTAGSEIATLGDVREELSAGDIVEVRFAQTRDPHSATKKETAHVTRLVERRDSELAKDVERRIVVHDASKLAPK